MQRDSNNNTAGWAVTLTEQEEQNETGDKATETLKQTQEMNKYGDK